VSDSAAYLRLRAEIYTLADLFDQVGHFDLGSQLREVFSAISDLNSEQESRFAEQETRLNELESRLADLEKFREIIESQDHDHG
jgi:hypothetical protein